MIGFKHVNGISRKGSYDIVRIVSVKSVNKFCNNTKTWLRYHRHWRIRDQQKALTIRLNGFYQYFALANCLPKLVSVRQRVQRQWRTALRRRSHRGKAGYWSYLIKQDWFYLPFPKLIRELV